MVTPELVQYIRSSLAAGKTRAEIQQALIAGGSWHVNDINEVFGAIDNEIPVHRTSYAGLIIVALIVLVGGGVWYVYGAQIKEKVMSIVHPQDHQSIIEKQTTNLDNINNEEQNNIAISPTPSTPLAATSTLVTSDAFLSYIKDKKSISCTANLSITNIDFSFVYFVSPTKFRIDSEMTVSNPDTATSLGTTHRGSSTIYDGTYAYDWDTESANGSKKIVKSPVVIDELFVKKIFEDPSYNPVCLLWQYDPVKFIPPSTVTFTEN